jgi:hypothetical protein
MGATSRDYLLCFTQGHNRPVIASDLEISRWQRYDLEGQDGSILRRQPAAADQQIMWWVTDTDRRKDSGVRPDRAQGAHEHEAKEHDLPLVQQRRA